MPRIKLLQLLNHVLIQFGVDSSNHGKHQLDARDMVSIVQIYPAGRANLRQVSQDVNVTGQDDQLRIVRQLLEETSSSSSFLGFCDLSHKVAYNSSKSFFKDLKCGESCGHYSD